MTAEYDDNLNYNRLFEPARPRRGLSCLGLPHPRKPPGAEPSRHKRKSRTIKEPFLWQAGSRYDGKGSMMTTNAMILFQTCLSSIIVIPQKPFSVQQIFCKFYFFSHPYGLTAYSPSRLKPDVRATENLPLAAIKKATLRSGRKVAFEILIEP